MNIADGFYLWIGRTLAEIAMIAVAIIGILSFAIIVELISTWKMLKKKRKNDEP